MTSYRFSVDTIEKIFQLLIFFARQGEAWIFRGQADAGWSLKSSLERAFKQFKIIDKNTKYEAEQHIIEMGRRTLCQDPSASSLIKDDLDLLSFLQHFGGITRLLDFSDSFAVALFFATETATDDASVWCLKRNALRYDEADLRNRDERRKFAEDIISGKNKRHTVVAFAPSMLNERIYAQQGLFIMPCTFDESLENIFEQKLQTAFDPEKIEKANLSALQDNSHNAVLMKFDIDKKLLRDTLVALRKINISADHLFPGITGICRSLSLLASGYRLNKNKFEIHGGEL